PIQPPANPTTAEPTLQLVGAGNPNSGRWLFHSEEGVGCYLCHRLEENGNAFGPDLSALATRSTVEHVVQSILQPNAVITEGYNQLTIETDDESLSGILIEESGLSVSLGLANGTRRTISKSRVESRWTSLSSAMPAYDTVLGARDVADLTAYLMATKAQPREQPEVPMSASGGNFAFELRGDRMLLKHKGQPLAEYVFVDSEIRRPHFANVYASSGDKVTRNHPPIEGVDATDHASMHPGIWLAFGDLNGNDFWRNKATVKHVRFVEGPRAENDMMTFAVENHWIGTDGSLVCRETARYTLAEQDFDGGVKGTTLIWDSTFHSEEHDLKFGHQEEMGLGIRVASDLTVKTGQGTILNSRGQRDGKQVWGNTADWWHYGGRLNDQFAGILIVTDNKLVPTSWGHARDYGALVVNPTKPPPAHGTFIGVKRGVPFRLRYGVLIYSAPDGFTLDQPVKAMDDLLSRSRAANANR
ncbi:MAG: DUF6807 family protein, partial [Planctomycetota bacterium]